MSVETPWENVGPVYAMQDSRPLYLGDGPYTGYIWRVRTDEGELRAPGPPSVGVNGDLLRRKRLPLASANTFVRSAPLSSVRM